MTNLEMLQTRKTAILTELSGLTAGEGLDAPTHTAAGRTFQTKEKIEGLYAELRSINDLIAAEDGPVDEEVLGVP